jgi:Putative adhesin
METFERSDPVTVAVRAGRGGVDITATDTPVVQVEVTPLDGSAAAAQAARDTHVALEGHTLVVDTPTRSGWQWRRTPNLAVTIRVPTGSSIVATVASAGLRADGRYAEARVKSASGEVWIDEVTGAALIESASGDVTVGRIGGALRIGSASGRVTVRTVVGDVAAKAASGDIAIRLAGGSVSAETASGDVTVGLVRQGQAAIRTASGDVEVGVAAGTGVWLDVSTVTGATVNELSMGGEAAGGAARPALRLRVRTASGDVAIRRVQGDLPAAA